MVSSYGAGSVDTDCPHHKRVRVSKGFVAASLLCLLSWILLLIAFASPYWLSSYAITYSPFVRLGLWDFCFNSYRHPPYQYDEKFTGCHWVYSAKFQNIRDWLQPGESAGILHPPSPPISYIFLSFSSLQDGSYLSKQWHLLPSLFHVLVCSV